MLKKVFHAVREIRGENNKDNNSRFLKLRKWVRIRVGDLEKVLRFEAGR